jgi:hypothetical protein
MEAKELVNLATKRTVIGYLGERGQFGWWQSSFFTNGSDSFLSPVFARTQFLAQYSGVSHAARLVHDERIGVGHVYHLFRLPEEMEQRIHHVLNSSELERMIKKIISSKESAINYLRNNSAEGHNTKAMGPTRVGGIKSLNDGKLWSIVCGRYLHAFENQLEIFPYISDNK